MKPIKTILWSAFVIAATFAAYAQGTLEFTAHLTSEIYSYTGNGTFSLTGTTLTYYVRSTYNFSVAEVHVPSATNGAYVFDLGRPGCIAPDPGGNPGWCDFGISPRQNTLQLSEDQVAQIIQGNAYVISYPPIAPDAVIRGQIVLIPEPGAGALLVVGATILLLKRRALSRRLTRTRCWDTFGAALLAWTLGLCSNVDAGQPLPPRLLVTNASSQIFKYWAYSPPTPAAASLMVSPSPATNFLAWPGNYLDAKNPPDTHGAVAPDYVVTLGNSGLISHPRTGSGFYSNSLDNFWTNVGISAFTLPFDPRAAYDPYEGRFIALAALELDPQVSSLAIGVSRSQNPSDTNWFAWKIPADPNRQYWADSPTLGFNKNWIVVQANMISTATNFQRSDIWVFNKTNLYAGVSNLVAKFSLTNQSSSGSEIAAFTYDNSATNLYLVQNVTGNSNGFGWLRIYCLSGTATNATLDGGTNFVKIPRTWLDLPTQVSGVTDWVAFEPQQGTNELISTSFDARVVNVVYRNNSLWTVQAVFTDNPKRSAVQWCEIRPEQRTLVQHGWIGNTNEEILYAFPSIAVNRFNDVLIGYNTFSPTQYVSAAYSFQAFYDQRQKLRETYTYQWGDGIYAVGYNRWGDYSMTCVDPANDADLWTIQQCANTNSHSEFSDHDGWALRWAQVKVDMPANNGFAAAFPLSGSHGSTNGTNLRATSEAGEPSHAGINTPPSVWYTWTSPTNGSVVIEIIGTGGYGGSFVPALAVYTGQTISNLTSIVSRAGDASGCKVIFGATTSTTYRIAVAGANNSMGDFVLSWHQPTLPMFVQHPQPRGTNVVGNRSENVTLTGWAIGNHTPAYQWRLEGTNLPGATSSNYAIVNAQTNHSTNYTLVVTNVWGKITSEVASVFVYDPPSATLALPQMGISDFIFHASGVTGRTYLIQASTNLSPPNWTTVGSNVVSFDYTNYAASSNSERYFRVVYP